MKNLFLFYVLFGFNFSLFGQEKGTNSKDDCQVINQTITSLNETTSLFHYFLDENRTGIIHLHPFKLEEVEWENFISSIKSDPDITFQYKGSKPSILFDGIYHNYQEFYKDVKVEDGGFTIFTNDSIQAIAPPCDGCPPMDPCSEVQMLTPHIYEGINTSVTPTISDTLISSILQGTDVIVKDIELRIVNNLFKNCEYRLVFLVKYFDSNEGDMMGWIDAHTGLLLHQTSEHNNKNAPTANFGIQNMNDQINGANTVLRNDRLAVHDMSNITGVDVTGELGGSFNDNQIPTSPTIRDWLAGDASEEVFQAFWMADQIITTLTNTLGISFTNVHIGVHPTAVGATSFAPGTPDTRSDFAIGVINGNSAVEYDVIAHELAHAIIREFIASTQIEGGSLHEGLADIFGTYIESILDPNGLDWIMGDDIPFTVRDLENTTRNCFTNIQNLTGVHARGEALGHWFFLCVNRSIANNIPPMDIDEVLALIVETLPNVGSNADYPDLMRAMISLAEKRYGTCSDQFLTILRSWETICVPTGHRMRNPNAPCAVLTGNTSICEESDYFNICLSSNTGLNTNFADWTIIGRNSTDFKSVNGMQGNSQYGGQCLQIVEIPEMPYYPQTVTITFRLPDLYGGYINISRRITIRDCNGDDLTCHEYYYGLGRPYHDESSTVSVNEFDEDNVNLFNNFELGEFKLIVYDIMGNLIQNGGNDSTSYYRSPQILIYTYWDEKGNLISSKKVLKY